MTILIFLKDSWKDSLVFQVCLVDLWNSNELSVDGSRLFSFFFSFYDRNTETKNFLILQHEFHE